MNYTDTQLKQALAKMLPERIIADGFYHRGECPEGRGFQPCILDTELLHLCWLVEDSLTDDQIFEYTDDLKDDCHATWQQRVIALAKVKGVEL